MASFEGQIADAAVAALEANKPAVVAAISTAEGGVEAIITNAVNNFQPKGTVLPLVWGVIKPAVIAELVSLEAQESGTVIFALIDAEAHTLAKDLGG